jgi:hypothetical protein
MTANTECLHVASSPARENIGIGETSAGHLRSGRRSKFLLYFNRDRQRAPDSLGISIVQRQKFVSTLHMMVFSPMRLRVSRFHRVEELPAAPTR